MLSQRALLATSLLALTLAGCGEPTQPARVGAVGRESRSETADDESGPVVTIDHQLPIVSTVPANAGEAVQLFLRERVRGDVLDGRHREAVLMFHGRSVPILAGSALEYGDYDWALWLARSGGFDVFMLDLQGSGRSPRPKMDDPCNVPLNQRALVPVSSPPCEPDRVNYPFTLTTTASDLDEIDAAVEYIRQLRGVDKVHLVSWSQGSFRAGPYAVRHPDKVASLLLYAPVFNTLFRPTNPPSPLPRAGTPMTLRTRADLFAGNGTSVGWDPEVKCEGQREPGIEDVVWAAIMADDDIGRSWNPPEGVMRVREGVQWGWNAEVASRLAVPTLIIRGEFDTGQGGLQQVHELYGLVQNDNKLRFTVQCAGHYMVWERQRWILHQVSKEWLKHGRVGGFTAGEFRIDTEGNIAPDVAQ